ncbi:MAG: M15 family metallopeptidase, partial [Anaerovoracaceae bacterium]
MNNEQGNLVKLVDYDTDFIIDLRYSTPSNFTGKKVYESNECWMDKHTCEILIKAKNIFKEAGYRVKIWDAYRPISAQAKFWDIMPDDDFVARPPDMSKITKFRPTHMNGLCVDVTLTD